MPFTDLDEHLEEAFGHAVPDLSAWAHEDGRRRTMHLCPKSRHRKRTARRTEVCSAAQKRWVHKRAADRRAAEQAATGQTCCAFPGCLNLLVPPWVVRRGPFAATCGKRCSQALAALKRALSLTAVLASVLGSHRATTL